MACRKRWSFTTWRTNASPPVENVGMTEDTALKILRDAKNEVLKTGMAVTVAGYSVDVLVMPNPGNRQGVIFVVRDSEVTGAAAAAAMAESGSHLVA
ncbi:hypothetical protein QTI33_26525 [Variovorax sp. J22P271]|uniref:hypothetical protein n=1 Tax=Variovorax davisae TaxID=3053515 RepID=UPI00257774F7|nr:hypothetical protein [Variovorax sp. J22P271]MDM0035716.1 hypothetical protein [Variovorax sp. J22P271]